MDLKQFVIPTQLDEGLVRKNMKPHTKSVKDLDSCCCGRETANYYFLCKYFDIPVDGEKVLEELTKLQDRDPSSEKYGCLRWYREEPYIIDTNAAFFIIQPLSLAFLLCREKLSVREEELIRVLMFHAKQWFTGECENHGLYYPNKIVSDGAMLLAVGTVTGDEAAIEKARAFWDRWLEYTEEYGWGWGENTSETYGAIIVGAFDYALCCLEKEDPLYERIYQVRADFMDYMAYHENYEFVPSIRTYNFEGYPKNDHEMNYMDVEAENYSAVKDGIVPYRCLTVMVLHQIAPFYQAVKDPSEFHKERIFADSYASTYKGKNIHLGTINKFPVIPGCYQEDGWGIGWQAMPVSVLAKNHETSFLRFANVADGKLKSHIAHDIKFGYLSASIFPDENIPDTWTYAEQVKNQAVIVRSMSHIANRSSYLADEWYLQHFKGEVCEYLGWYVFDYGDCALAVKPLNGEARVIRDGEKIRVARVLYEGDEKLLVRRKEITAWAVTVFDGDEDFREILKSLPAYYDEIKDLRYPREIPLFQAVCGEAKIMFDSHKECSQ